MGVPYETRGRYGSPQQASYGAAMAPVTPAKLPLKPIDGCRVIVYDSAGVYPLG
jgi:hypothetical protein